jgi:cytochrome bd ubiquinol oxidase subunit I
MSTSEFLQALLRAQFGLSAGFHFLFVPLSIGLLLFVCVLRTTQAYTGKSFLGDAAQHWQRFFLVTWATGIATGYPLRAQLQENWATYINSASVVLAEIFKIEGSIAPWMFGSVLLLALCSRRLPPLLNAVLSWFLLGLMGLQALTILAVNAWMQAPVGVEFDRGSWHMTSLSAVLLSETALHKSVHTLSASMLCGTFFVVAASAAHLNHLRHRRAAAASVYTACWIGLCAVGVTLLSGHESAGLTARTQPMKFAAYEAHWEAEPGPAPWVAWGIPDEKLQANAHEVSVPYVMSLLTPGSRTPPGILDLERGHAEHLRHLWAQEEPARIAMRPELQGMDADLYLTPQPQDRGWLLLRDSVAARHPLEWARWSRDEQIAQVAKAARPAVLPLFVAFRVMVACGLVCLLLCALAFWQRHALVAGERPGLLKAMRWATPLPWLAILSGWFVAEVGRQPWTIQGQLPTFHASQHPSLETGVLGAFGLVLAGALIAMAWYAIVRQIWLTGPMGQVLPLRLWLNAWLPGARSRNA